MTQGHTSLVIRQESWPIRGTFTISRGSKTTAEIVVVELTRDGRVGRGECVPYPRYGETVAGVMAEIEQRRAAIEGGVDRRALQGLMKPGAARNAVDCALWDLEAKLTGRPVWDLAGLRPPGSVVTAYTLSVDTPEKMAEAARANAERPLLKIKLTGAGDLDRLRAIRSAAPQSRLIADANEGWSAAQYAAEAGALAGLGVEVIEQPLPASDDGGLAGVARPVPVCADEAAHDRAGLDHLVVKYDMINIKLDKTGGLTEALALREAARAAGLKIMVGCMIGTSLAMAPAMLVAQGAEVVDLDAPLLLARDREPGLVYRGSVVEPPSAALWG
jgi:L-alanine-DL-glutamate epimerase-like enolase superfamily enzyme